MPAVTRPAPSWFTIDAALLLLWNLFGGFVWVQQQRFGADAMGPASAYQRELFASLPGWYSWNFLLAEVAGIGGSVALLLHRRIALPLFWVSLAGVVIQFGYLLLGTGIIANEGLATAAGLPMFVILVCVVQVWLAQKARAQGWIG